MIRAVALVAVAAAAAACGGGRMVRSGQVNAPALEKVERGLAHVRGLPFTQPVPAKVLDDAQVAALIERELALEFRPGELERLSLVYARLGFTDPDTALEPALRELYGDQIAALYDPREKTLSLTAAGLRQETTALRVVGFFTGRDLVGELLVAHELTHALQDQHWGLPTTPEPMTNANGDRSIARRALVEGDASLASVAYVRQGPLDPETVERFTEQVAGIPEELRERHPNVPEIVRASLAFQYNTGSVFAAAAYLRGGWPAVDAAEADPPTSSEQVLHPEKYFDTRENPHAVILGGLDDLERRGWTRVLEDTFGELDVRALFGRVVDPIRAVGIAAGWGGDRCRVLVRGDAMIVAWLSVWDGVDDARDFAENLPQVVGGAHVERRDARVLVLIAPRDVRGLAERIWARSRISPAG
jgi:hypothetical protein